MHSNLFHLIIFFYFFIKCMQFMTMILFKCCIYVKLHVIWSKLLLYIFSLINHINNLHIQVLSLKLSSIKSMLHTLYVTYIRHNFYADFLMIQEIFSFLVINLQFKTSKISYCLNFNNLLFKHELQMFHQWYSCILQSISSLITLTYIIVLLNYINDVFN